MQVDRNDLIRTLSDLVRINSINPTLVPGAPGEAEIAGYVAGWLGDAGLAILVDEPEPGRPSVAARLKGSGGGRSLMLNAHMDTVAPASAPTRRRVSSALSAAPSPARPKPRPWGRSTCCWPACVARTPR